LTLKIIIAGVIPIASANYIICGYEEKNGREYIRIRTGTNNGKS
jgi:hypothetical protein